MDTTFSVDDLPAREIRAPGPAPGEKATRVAYLELLKLCLCDLAGSGTVSVGRTNEGRMFTRELSSEMLKPRAVGMDWPLNGLTMIGLARLDDLQSCVETVVRDGVEGDMIEAGAWRGGASILVRATLDSLGAIDRALWVADSFQGFPSPDDDEFPQDRDLQFLSDVDFLAAPLGEVRGHFERLGLAAGVNFVEGFFEDTMPGLRGGCWSLVRLDGDSYEATKLALESLYPGLAAGGYLIIDDYSVDECRHAVDEFRRGQGIEEPIEEIDWVSARWRRQDEPGTSPEGAPLATVHADSPRTLNRDPDREIPRLTELGLEDSLDAARKLLDTTEAEVNRLRRAPLRRLADKLRGGRTTT